MNPLFFQGIEVSGLAIQAIVQGFESSNALVSRMLLAEGIGRPGSAGRVQIDRSEWYPLDRCLEVIGAISADLGDAVLFQIGNAVAEIADIPITLRDVHEAIRAVDTAFHGNHRRLGPGGGDWIACRPLAEIGHYGYQRVDAKRIASVVSSPYPCSFDRGLLTARARRFQPNAWVFHDDTKPCRKHGSTSCTYQITWL